MVGGGRVRPHPAVGDFGYSSVRRDVSGRGPQTSALIIGGNGSQRWALDFSFLFSLVSVCPKVGSGAASRPTAPTCKDRREPWNLHDGSAL